MYYSVNISLLSISTGDELEDLNPAEKALRLEGVAIFQFFIFLSEGQNKKIQIDNGFGNWSTGFFATSQGGQHLQWSQLLALYWKWWIS